MEPTQDDYIRLFEPLERMQRRYSDLGRDGPAPGSRAAKDGLTKLGRMAWILGLSASSIGVDHLVAWRMLRLRGGYLPNFAHWTLIRGAIEGTAIGRWLCESTISSGERLQRSAGVQFDDYEQRLAFENRMGARMPKPTGKGRTAQQRIDDLWQRLGAVEPIKMPSATRLFEMYAMPDNKEHLAGERFFRVISAVPHAKVWSLPALIDVAERVEQPGGGLAIGVKVDDRLVLYATQVAMSVAEAALADVEWYGSSEVEPASLISQENAPDSLV